MVDHRVLQHRQGVHAPESSGKRSRSRSGRCPAKSAPSPLPGRAPTAGRRGRSTSVGVISRSLLVATRLLQAPSGMLVGRDVAGGDRLAPETMITSNWSLPPDPLAKPRASSVSVLVGVGVAGEIGGVQLLLRGVERLPGLSSTASRLCLDHPDGGLLHQQEAAEHQDQDGGAEDRAGSPAGAASCHHHSTGRRHHAGASELLSEGRIDGLRGRARHRRASRGSPAL